MTYAAHRRIIDADSHVIELDDFLSRFADPADRALIPPMDAQTELPVVPEGLARGRELFARRQSDPETMAKFEAQLLDARRSGWNRIGAFDPQERSHCLDLLGFDMQLILPTFSFHQIAHCKQPPVLEAGARTLNRAMGAFCAHDSRLRAIGYIPLSLGPEVAAAATRSWSTPTNRIPRPVPSHTPTSTRSGHASRTPALPSWSTSP